MEESIDLATVPMLASISSSSTIYVEDKGTIGRITIEQLKQALNSL